MQYFFICSNILVRREPYRLWLKDTRANNCSGVFYFIQIT
nr:MAG TPA: hypothetical protein [Caudoviricetes sp.]